MARLDWASAPRIYSAGVSQAVLYVDGVGMPWNGLVSVDEGAAAAQSTDNYFDGRRLAISEDIGNFEAVIQAYTYPDILDPSVQNQEDLSKKTYGLSYRTNNSNGDHIHVVYSAYLKPSSKAWNTIQTQVNPHLFRWDVLATSVNIPGSRPGAHLVIDTANTSLELVNLIEGWLYGTSNTDPRLPAPEEFVDIFEAATTLRITQHGDGTWSAEGPDHIVQVEEDGSFHISAPTAQYLEVDVFTVESF